LDNLHSGKRYAKCIGKRIVAGKVTKESYGREKQQHTFTVRFDTTVCTTVPLDTYVYSQNSRLHYLFNSIDSSILEQRSRKITTFAFVACQRAQPIQNDDFSSGSKSCPLKLLLIFFVPFRLLLLAISSCCPSIFPSWRV